MEQGPEFHTRIVVALKVGLPLVAAGLLLSVFIFRPSEDRGGEIVFSEADLDQLGQGLQISNPTFTGTTGSGDRFRFTADLVEPDAAPPTRASITRLEGQIDFQTGLHMDISADGGELEIPDQTLDLAGSVKFRTSEGYDLAAERLSLDLANGVIDGSGSVRGDAPLGRITSGTVRVAPTQSDKDIRRFSFGKGVRVIYDPPDSGDEAAEKP